MLLNELQNCIQLHSAEASGALQHDRFEPDLCHHVFAPDLDVGRFAPIQRHEEEPKRTNSKDRRHIVILSRQAQISMGRPSAASGDPGPSNDSATQARPAFGRRLQLPVRRSLTSREDQATTFRLWNRVPELFRRLDPEANGFLCAGQRGLLRGAVRGATRELGQYRALGFPGKTVCGTAQAGKRGKGPTPAWSPGNGAPATPSLHSNRHAPAVGFTRMLGGRTRITTLWADLVSHLYVDFVGPPLFP